VSRWTNSSRLVGGVEVLDGYTRVRGIASARWLWLAIDPVSKVIPSLHIGGRTKGDAFALVHDVQQRLEPGCIPAFTSEGLRRLIQRAFIERVNLTFRQGVSALSRRTRAMPRRTR
jgi:IS1 family transposase